MLVAALVVGCDLPQHHQDPPVVLAEQTNSTGVVTQLILQRNYTTQLMWFGTDGSHNVVTYDFRYYLQETGKPRRELPIKGTVFTDCETFKAVGNTTLWVGMGPNTNGSRHPVGHAVTIRGHPATSRNEDDFDVVVFDDKHVLAHHKFLVISKIEIEEDAVRLKDGNRTIVFLSPTGPKKYDVLKDSVGDAADEKWPPPHFM